MQEIISLLSLVLSGISAFQGLRKKTDRDRVVFLRQMAPLFSELDFCKKIHSVFQEFYFITFEGFLDHIKEKETDVQFLSTMWKKDIGHYYKRNMHRDIVDRLPQKEEEVIKKVKVDSRNIPLSIKEAVQEITSIYPELLQNVNQFAIKYNEQTEELSRDSKEYFDARVKYMKGISETIMNDSDTMILHTIPVLMFIYDHAVQ